MTSLRSEPLDEHHLLDDFDCGSEELNTWLKSRAPRNEGKFALTFVICEGDHRVTGFYSLAAGSVDRWSLGKSLQRNAPESILVVILGRFAVEGSLQGIGIGTSLLQDAFRRTLHASLTVGVRLLLLHAKNDRVREYYTRVGFRPLPEHPLAMVLPLESILAALED